MGKNAELFRIWRHTYQWSADDVVAVLGQIFNEIALSPYTDFVAKTLNLLAILKKEQTIGLGDEVDFLAARILQTVRHLTAYDLKTFHHHGANYPDILVLDEALKSCLQRVREHPAAFLDSGRDGPAICRKKRRRRRALCHGILLRHSYEGLPVPEVPTSPGENARIMPGYPSVPDEQITNPASRRKRLFADDPVLPFRPKLPAGLIKQILADLEHPSELCELGNAIFLDRPLGILKGPGEADATCLLSYLAFSPSVAASRLGYLAEKLHWLSPSKRDGLQSLLVAVRVEGQAAQTYRTTGALQRISLGDAARVADDFVFIRTLPRAVEAFLEEFDFAKAGVPLELFPRPSLIIRSADMSSPLELQLNVFDENGRLRLELRMDGRNGYETRAGKEYPRNGLILLRAFSVDGAGTMLPTPLRIPPRC
jgi:hypothetical protein